MGLKDIGPVIETDNRRRVMVDTWGHLRPVKDRAYTGRIVFAIGCWDSGDLNPTPIICAFCGLADSPWFYDGVNEFLQDLPARFRKPGRVYEWRGEFSNYEFSGTCREIFNPNAK